MLNITQSSNTSGDSNSAYIMGIINYYYLTFIESCKVVFINSSGQIYDHLKLLHPQSKRNDTHLLVGDHSKWYKCWANIPSDLKAAAHAIQLQSERGLTNSDFWSWCTWSNTSLSMKNMDNSPALKWLHSHVTHVDEAGPSQTHTVSRKMLETVKQLVMFWCIHTSVNQPRHG